MTSSMRFPFVALRSLSLATVLLCVLCVNLAACGKKDEAAGAPPPSPATPVKTAAVEQRTIAITAEAVGNVEPLASVAIKSRIDGQISEVHARDGQDVNEGQLLFVLDPRPSEIDVRKAEAALARDQALLTAAVAQEARYGDLLKQGYVTPDQYSAIKGNLDTLQAAVQTDQSAIDDAKMHLGYTRIRAPISGRLGKIALQRGNLVKGNDTQVMVTINQLDPVYVSFSLREQLLPDIRAALARGRALAEAIDPQGKGEPVRGKLSFIDNSVDPATGTIKLRATFDNPKDQLWPGQFVSVRLTLGEEANALAVPLNAVQTGPKGTYLYVVDADSKAQQRDVTIVRSTAEVVVVSKGVAAGERVIVDGQSRVAPGATVSVQAPAAAAASSKN